MRKIYGIQFEEIQPDVYPIWKLYLRNPFMWEGKYQVGINEKLLLTALKEGVNKFILHVGERDIMMNVPSEKGLKEKVKKSEFEDKKSLFLGSPPIRIFYFEV